jgi:DNA-binding transcriptional LysR family regulator
MEQVLDIVPLRSFVAVADRGGFQRAATHLHLSQAAVSQHVRRLESATGRRLVQRDGRRSRFTADGDQLLGYARQILALHGEALRSFGLTDTESVVIGRAGCGSARDPRHHAGRARPVPRAARARTRSAHRLAQARP